MPPSVHASSLALSRSQEEGYHFAATRYAGSGQNSPRAWRPWTRRLGAGGSCWEVRGSSGVARREAEIDAVLPAWPETVTRIELIEPPERPAVSDGCG